MSSRQPATLLRYTRTSVVGCALGLAGAAAMIAAAAGTASASPFEEPVSVTATAPAAVSSGTPFQLEVAVAAEAGALDIAAQPLRLRVKFEPECGGSFAGTDGPVAIDQVLPAPVTGAPYAQTVTASETLRALGPETICAFVEDSQERQFATDTEAELTVRPSGSGDGGGGGSDGGTGSSGGGGGGGGGSGSAGGGATGTSASGPQCAAATVTLGHLERNLKKLDHRIHRLRRRIKHTGAARKRRAETRHLTKLRKRRHRLAHRKRTVVHLVTVNCGSAG